MNPFTRNANQNITAGLFSTAIGSFYASCISSNSTNCHSATIIGFILAGICVTFLVLVPTLRRELPSLIPGN